MPKFSFNKIFILRFLLIAFYSVGITGILVPATRQLVISLVPIALLFSFICLSVAHEGKIKAPHLMLFFAIYLLGYLIEVVGVNTGLVFGKYQYGEGLGIKLFATPLIIGLNWLFLVYLSIGLIQRYKLPSIWQSMAASAIMVGYDVLLEHLAPYLGMWVWEGGKIPLQNYVAWFLIALAFNYSVTVSKLKIRNKLIALVLACQVLFLSILLILKNVQV